MPSVLAWISHPITLICNLRPPHSTRARGRHVGRARQCPERIAAKSVCNEGRFKTSHSAAADARCSSDSYPRGAINEIIAPPVSFRAISTTRRPATGPAPAVPSWCLTVCTRAAMENTCSCTYAWHAAWFATTASRQMTTSPSCWRFRKRQQCSAELSQFSGTTRVGLRFAS
jgi:hypothetical protein